MSRAPSDLAKLFEQGSDQGLSEKIAELERQLEAEKDCRREDKFVALVLILGLVDLILLQNAAAAVTGIVFVLQVVFLAMVAKRLGVEQIGGLLDRLLDHVAKRN